MKKPKKGDTVTYHRMRNGAAFGAPPEAVPATVDKVHRGMRGEVVDLVVPVLVHGVPEEVTLERIVRGTAPHPNRWTDGTEGELDEETSEAPSEDGDAAAPEDVQARDLEPEVRVDLEEGADA